MAVAAAGAFARWAATTPNAARPNVNNAAKTTTTTRILPSATTATLPIGEVKAQTPDESTKTRRHPIKDADRGFRIQDCADPLVSAAEFVLPTAHRAGQGQRRCRKNPARDGARHHIGGDRAKAGQADVGITQRTAAG